MRSIIKEFIQWRRERAKKLQIAKGNKEYLINTFADVTFLKKVVNECNKDPDLVVTMWTVDGTRLDIKTVHTNSNKRTIINGNEY